MLCFGRVESAKRSRFSKLLKCYRPNLLVRNILRESVVSSNDSWVRIAWGSIGGFGGDVLWPAE